MDQYFLSLLRTSKKNFQYVYQFKVLYCSILPCNRFSVSQNFCSSLKYLSRIKTLEMPNVVDIVVNLQKNSKIAHLEATWVLYYSTCVLIVICIITSLAVLLKLAHTSLEIVVHIIKILIFFTFILNKNRKKLLHVI